MFWFLLVGCFVIGWVQQAARKEASRAGRYYNPPAAQPKQRSTKQQPRKIILPEAMTPEELAEFGPGWLTK
jgi:hypothetical protein